MLDEARSAIGDDVTAEFRAVRGRLGVARHPRRRRGGPARFDRGARLAQEPGAAPDEPRQHGRTAAAGLGHSRSPWCPGTMRARRTTNLPESSSRTSTRPDGQAALRHAVSIAARLGASLELVSVVPDTRVIPSMGDIRRFGHEQRAAYAEALDRALAGLPEGTKATGRLIDGSVVDALADITPDTADLLVCGSRVTDRPVECCWAACPPACSGMPGCRSSWYPAGELAAPVGSV